MKLAPSILAADFARSGAQVAEAEKAGAYRIQLDVMGGHFVPNLSIGASIVASLRPVTRLPLGAQLMISNPNLFLREFADSGSASLLVHWEGNVNLHRTVQSIRALGNRHPEANEVGEMPQVDHWDLPRYRPQSRGVGYSVRKHLNHEREGPASDHKPASE